MAARDGVDIKKVWPEYFADKAEFAMPSTGADMSGFQWEAPTPQSYESDMAALDRIMQTNQSVKLRESPPAPQAPPAQPSSAAEMEWT